MIQQVSRNIKHLQIFASRITSAEGNVVSLAGNNFLKFNFSQINDSNNNDNSNKQNFEASRNRYQQQNGNYKSNKGYVNRQHNQVSGESGEQQDKHKQSTALRYFDFSKPLYEFQGDRIKLGEWLGTNSTYSHQYNKEEFYAFRTNLMAELRTLNDQVTDMNEAFRIFIKLYIYFKTLFPRHLTSRNQYIIRQIKHCKTDEEALFYLVMECTKFMRSWNKELREKNFPQFIILRLALYVNYRFNFIKVLQFCEDTNQLQGQIQDMIALIYDFHSQKLLKKINHDRLSELYDKVITLCHKMHLEPSLQFSQKNIKILFINRLIFFLKLFL